MATTASFNDMLKRYMPYELLVEEMKKRSYFWNKVDKDQDWVGGTLEVPFEGGEASSMSFGSLTAASDIAEGTYVMGTLSTQPELWGTMKFNEKDLDRHGDMEKSYLKLVPGKIDQFVRRMQERVSIMLLGDGSVAKLTADGANGSITVDHPERFSIGEKIYVDDDNSAASAAGYVTAININTGVLTVKDARSSGSALDLTAYTTGQNAKVYLDGAQSNGFTGLRTQLLSASNGGASTIAGVTKATYPHLQAVNVDGSGFTAATILADLFEAFFVVHKLGKGNPGEILVSFDIFKEISNQLELTKQASITDKAAGYGWRSVTLLGVDGEMKVTAIREMPSNTAYIMDWSALKFFGHKFFDRKRHLNGDEFFLVRNTTGYEYIVDCKFYGDLLVHKPSHCGVIHSIPTL